MNSRASIRAGGVPSGGQTGTGGEGFSRSELGRDAKAGPGAEGHSATSVRKGP